MAFDSYITFSVAADAIILVATCIFKDAALHASLYAHAAFQRRMRAPEPLLLLRFAATPFSRFARDALVEICPRCRYIGAAIGLCR